MKACSCLVASVIGAAILFTLTLTPARAETVRFPPDDPAFAITFPDRWKTKTDPKDHTLSSQPAPDRPCVLTVREFEGVDDLAAAKTGLPKFAVALAKGAGVKDLKPSQEMVEMKSPRGIPMLLAEFRGTNEAGGKMVVTTVVFQPGEDADVFVLAGVASEEEDKKMEQEAQAIVGSIVPI